MELSKKVFLKEKLTEILKRFDEYCDFKTKLFRINTDYSLSGIEIFDPTDEEFKNDVLNSFSKYQIRLTEKFRTNNPKNKRTYSISLRTDYVNDLCNFTLVLSRRELNFVKEVIYSYFEENFKELEE